MCRILLVDDEDLELQGLSLMIKGFDLPLEICATARNGQEGLEKARQLRPDVILTDLAMPVLTGIEMLNQVPCQEYAPHSIIISGYEDFEAARAGIDLGVSSYLLKPVKREELFRALYKLLPARSQNDRRRPLSADAPVFLYSPEEEHLLRHALTAPQEKTKRLLAQPPFSDSLERKKLAVFSLVFSAASCADMYDLRPFLQRFAKEMEALVPVVTDHRTAAIVFTLPGFMEESSAIDRLSKTADKLLEQLYSQQLRDVFIGISDISEEAEQLSELSRQSISAVQKRESSPLSHVLFYEKQKNTGEQQEASQPNTIVTYVQRFIDENYAKPLNTEAIVENLYLSPSYVRRIFKSHMGISIMDYVERVRMDHAARMLGQLQYKIQEIGMLTGYESPSYFNLVFKKYFGLTPGEYRRQVTRQ